MAKTSPDELELQHHGLRRWSLRIGGGVILVGVLMVGSFELVYAGKVFPGVSADGVAIAGLSLSDAKTHIGDATTTYAASVLPVNYGNTTLHVPLNTLKLKYDTDQVSSLAYNYGRTGSVVRRAHEQLRALFNHSTNFAAYAYDDTQLTPFVQQVSDTVTTPVSDATLSFSNNQAQVVPASDGHRLNLGRLVISFEASFATTSTSGITAPVYDLPAAVTTAALTNATPEADTDLTSPLKLTYNDDSVTVDQATIAKWMKVTAGSEGDFMDTHDVRDLYPVATTASLAVDPTAITTYVKGLAANIDQDATNAQLSMDSGQLTVVKASQNGVELDQAGAVKAITAELAKTTADRTVALSVKTSQAAVREDNLSTLGINTLISEGETYFPGSPSTRLTNVRAGASKFNDVLLAPGEVFSFGKLLGEVDASTGYVPELVILGDHEDYQYGGGLCQVSTTAFRAALLAGLPINERVNHSFAISYYTWPYGVPGVDATIYYPSIDMKFTNDTGSYILIQTTMKGTDLKFDYYGTKTKSGVIRGPNFVSGTNDATQPSHTVFYRDVLDLSGNVTKTDTFQTYYQPSTNYPIVKSNGYN